VESKQQGKMSFKEQIEAMASAGVVVGMHGADLTNCIFMPTSTVLIEINPPHWWDLNPKP
jgi:capsular polysaccharide biosynthesis protein